MIPIPMLLVCPVCCERHVDVGEFATRPHKAHACQDCGTIWTPALVPTVGVLFLPGCKNGEPAPVEPDTDIAYLQRCRREQHDDRLRDGEAANKRLIAEIKAAEDEKHRLLSANTNLADSIRWALGMGESFPSRQGNQGIYWWRAELSRRSAIPLVEPSME